MAGNGDYSGSPQDMVQIPTLTCDWNNTLWCLNRFCQAVCSFFSKTSGGFLKSGILVTAETWVICRMLQARKTSYSERSEERFAVRVRLRLRDYWRQSEELPSVVSERKLLYLKECAEQLNLNWTELAVQFRSVHEVSKAMQFSGCHFFYYKIRRVLTDFQNSFPGIFCVQFVLIIVIFENLYFTR